MSEQISETENEILYADYIIFYLRSLGVEVSYNQEHDAVKLDWHAVPDYVQELNAPIIVRAVESHIRSIITLIAAESGYKH